MPDYCQVGMGQICSAKFRDLLERLDPGIHQFVPVEIVTKKKDHIADMFWFIPCNRLDTLVLDQISPLLDEMGYFYFQLRPENQPLRIVFDREKIGQSHIWCERRCDGWIWTSNTFKDMVASEELQGLDFTEHHLH